MRILLIGKAGQLGSDILQNNVRHEIIAPDQDSCDIRSRAMVNVVFDQYRPDMVINTVDFHDVPFCENDPATAFSMNCVAVRDMAAACNNVGSLFVTFSTDYVFDGEKKASYVEDDKPAPLQMYGISRLGGEYAAMAAAPGRAMIIRSCGLYGLSDKKRGGKNFVDQRIADAESGQVQEMGGDQVVSPTYSHDLSTAVLQLIEHPEFAPGVYHLVNEGKCSWYEFTKAIYDIMGFNVRMKPVDRSGKAGDLNRPLYSALANTKARSLGILLPPWRDALQRYLIAAYGKQIRLRRPLS
ncbi:MAG TPA: dTDP-4-dehydrorhamnose reductase [Nitrospirota bacterium]|nr:dTDP-4-dehydrorhamnose reductase [Nitrospirota bacterium]